jgi:hypothetical protein
MITTNINTINEDLTDKIYIQTSDNSGGLSVHLLLLAILDYYNEVYDTSTDIELMSDIIFNHSDSIDIEDDIYELSKNNKDKELWDFLEEFINYLEELRGSFERSINTNISFVNVIQNDDKPDEYIYFLMLYWQEKYTDDESYEPDEIEEQYKNDLEDLKEEFGEWFLEN